MATMAGVVCSRASLLPCAAHFARTTVDIPSCSTSSGSSGSVSGGLHSAVLSRQLGCRKTSLVLRARAFSSASSSFQGRLCLVLSCPTGKVREGKRSGVRASLLGVGAPEALVIGVVALLVFGPKGLAEVARTLGKSLRAFQPTIKELQQVSREFKATLEQEIGLDELRNPTPYDSPPTSTPSRPNTVSSTPTSMPTTLSATEAPPAAPKTEEAPAPPKPYTTEDYVRITEDQAKALVSEEQRKASEAAAWGGAPPVKPVAETSSEDQAQMSADSAAKDGSGVVGSTPTEPLEKSSDNGSPKL
ncbi:hypothetical protein M758_10G130500 [Ceratodon purpureus]|uniref:Sec-independent protein translocase protein TATB, chloroplastic n=1 Tax=Ceratodon purpureus TaxID=3225 RepID=A0A8T0GK10_CERPU|nr:hypothetical protein KC19_10G136000 [Ceratodon purpureus]KAG0603919.1 hypothetical protein M758_10G130500 [Ceratodon purpureus]